MKTHRLQWKASMIFDCFIVSNDIKIFANNMNIHMSGKAYKVLWSLKKLDEKKGSF